MNQDTLLKRIDELIKKAGATDRSENVQDYIEVCNGALTLLSSVYGRESHQVTVLTTAVAECGSWNNPKVYIGKLRMAQQVASGALSNLRGEIKAGLVGDLQKRLTGEVLADLVQLARTLLSENGEAGKDVAAVLAAAAFEDTVRRMGSSFAGTMGGENLNDVLQALKSSRILVGPQFSVAQSYLTFRNKALHAEWNKIDRPTVSSVLGFVEELILKHFG